MKLRKGQIWVGILFVILGILLVLKNFGFISHGIWSYLWKLWPLLLIFIGLEILITNKVLRGVIVLIFALLAVLIVVGKERPSWRRSYGKKVVIGVDSTNKYQFVIKESLKGFEELEVDCKGFSDLDIEIKGKIDSILFGELTVFSSSGVRIYEDSVEFKLEKSGKSARLKVKDLRWSDEEGFKNLFLAERGLKGHLKLEVPEGLNLSIDNVNGDLTLKSYKGGEFTVNSVNGDTKLQDAEFSEVTIDEVNGDLNLSGMRVGKELVISTVSGDAILEKISTPQLVVNTVSGDLDLGDDLKFKELDVTTVSGDVKAVVTEDWLKGEANFETVSGDVILTKKGISDIPVYVEKALGKTSKSKVSSGNYRINVETVSGEVKVQ